MILSVENLSHSYGDRVLFENISFNVEEGDKYGIIGVNGTGKSTLLRLIANREAGAGKLTIPGGIVMEYLPQDPPFEAEATVLEQVFKGDSPLMVLLRDYELAVEAMNANPDDDRLQRRLLDLQQQMDNEYAWQLESEAKAVLTQLGITNLQQKMGELSGGQRKRVALAGVLVRPSDLLILDEPTAVLTPQEVTELFVELKKLRDMGHTIVFISHKLNEVKELCDSFTILRRGRTVAVGNVNDYTEQELSNMMVGRDVSLEVEKGAPAGEKREALRVENLYYNSVSGKQLLQSVSFSLYRGRILGVAGVEGNGQKELSEILTGLRSFTRGEITLEGESVKGKSVRQIRQMGISNISEDRMTYGCAPTMSVTDNIIADRYYSGKYSHGIRLNVKAIRHDVEELVKTFDVVCPGTASMSGMLSGGNIQKMIAAREFTSGARVIVANQPTRGIDVGSSEFIHQQLVRLAREQDAAVLLVSADLTELLQLSDSLIVMFGGEITAYFPDSREVNDLMLGEYMLGVRKMTAEEIQEALQ